MFVMVLPNSENLNMAPEGLDKVSERGRVEGRRRREVPSEQLEDHEDLHTSLSNADLSHSMN